MKNEIDIIVPWNRAKTGLLTPAELSTEIAKQLESLPKQLLGVDFFIVEFEDMGARPTTTADEFNTMFGGLWNWAHLEQVSVKTGFNWDNV